MSYNIHEIDLVTGPSLAATVMAERSNQSRRKRKTYTGSVDGRRRPVGSLIQLPDGTVAELIGASRGRAFFRWHDPTALDPVRLGWARVGDVRHYPLPAARLLGSLKRGVKEAPSEKKRRALRLNALKRHHPTRRPRSTNGRARTRVPS